MYDREDVLGIADQIVSWEIVAQQMPLRDLAAMLADCQSDLAHSLNAFQEIYGHADHVPADTLKEAIGGIARQATATAIFALGVSQRVRLAAQQN
jgi:hypothetical protein